MSDFPWIRAAGRYYRWNRGYLEAQSEGLPPAPGGVMVQVGNRKAWVQPVSTITGRPIKGPAENPYRAASLGDILIGLARQNAPWKTYKPTPKEYFETPSIYSGERGDEPYLGEVDPPGVGLVDDLARMRRFEVLGLKKATTARDKLTAFEELSEFQNRYNLKKQIIPTEAVGDLRAQRTAMAYSKANLSKAGKDYMNWIEKMRNKSALHPNSKTTISMDFSTDCPKRLQPCPYCYVELGRTGEDIGVFAGRVKKGGVETPYRREILAMPSDVINELNRNGGLRAHSFGDYRPTQDYNDWAMALSDAEAKGLYIKAITKQPEFVRAFGDHPNLRINISVDDLPAGMSNAPTIEEAVKLKAGRDNIKIRAVALNEEQAWNFANDPRIDVVTLYHGVTGDKLKKIVEAQNPELIRKFGKKKVFAELDKWQNMPSGHGPKGIGGSKSFRRLSEKHSNKICCQSGACGGDPTKCGFGLSAAGGLIAGVILPELSDEAGFDSPGDAPVGPLGYPGLGSLNPQPLY